MTETVFEHVLVRESEVTAVRTDFGRIDLLIVCRSWESRSLLALEKLGAEARKILIIEFSPSHGVAARSTEAGQVEASASARSCLTVSTLGRSTEVDANFSILERVLTQEVEEIGVTAHVVVDVSSLPKYYSMALVAWALKAGSLCRISCFYSEGEYDDVSSSESAATVHSTLGRFTDGDWRVQQVRFLEGRNSVRDSRRVIAFCGAEEDRIIPQLERYEDHVRRIVVSSGGGKLAESAQRRRAMLVSAMNVKLDDVDVCEPFSVCQALGILRSVVFSLDSTHGGVIVLPFSTKPHALACAVAGFNSSAAVFSRVPQGYSARGVKATGRVYKYSFFDLSHPGVLSVL